jgi:adenylate cyclase
MAIEIERKFLVIGDGWKQGASRVRHLKQAYLAINDKLSIRVRIESTAAALTIKTASAGRQRAEYEYAIPLADADSLLRLCEGSVIAKTRHLVPVGKLAWEVDVFEGDNAGLVIADIELDRVDRQVERPASRTGKPLRPLLEAEAKAAAEEETRARAQAEEKRKAEGRKRNGPPPTPPSEEPDGKAQRNFTDPQSRILKSKDGFIQGYNAQAAVDGEAQVIVAHALTQSTSDQDQLAVLLGAIAESG